MPTSSLPSDFRLRQTVPREPAARRPRRSAASGQVGPYELVEEIGRGGMGVVYTARDDQGVVVALKVMREWIGASASLAERFRREADVVSQIKHPNIVPIHALGRHGDQFYLVMDYVCGGTLDENLNRFLNNERFAASTMAKVCRAIHHCHQQGILHRDLKPGNVLLDEADEPRITDFGVAKLSAAADSELTRKGELIGTPAYMSPEQATGKNELIGPATDVWGLGAILYELLTGLKPFPGGDQASMLYAIQAAPPLAPRIVRPQLAAPLERIVLRCLTKNPRSRYPSALALAEDLERWLRGDEVRAAAAPGTAFPAGHVVRVASAAAFALALIALLWFTTTDDPPPAARPADGIQEQLRSGKRVELLRDGLLPRAHRWPRGPGQQVEERPFGFESYSPCLLELAAAIPTSRYRLRLEAKARSIGMGETGLYFAYAEQASAGERDHYHCSLICSEAEHFQRMSLEVHRHRGQADSSGVFHSAVLSRMPLTQTMPPLDDWRELAVEVTEQFITAYVDGQHVGTVPWSAVTQLTGTLARLEPATSAPPAMSPQAAAGIYLRTANTTVRSFVLEPVN